MRAVINTKTLRKQFGSLLKRVKRGESFTVLYRSHPVCLIVPIGDEHLIVGDSKSDPLYQAPAVGRSSDGKAVADHDELLYGKRNS